MKQSGYYGVDGKWRPKAIQDATRINPLDPANHHLVHQTKKVGLRKPSLPSGLMIKIIGIMIFIFCLMMVFLSNQ